MIEYGWFMIAVVLFLLALTVTITRVLYRGAVGLGLRKPKEEVVPTGIQAAYFEAETQAIKSLQQRLRADPELAADIEAAKSRAIARALN
jgi:hypothetical protein